MSPTEITIEDLCKILSKYDQKSIVVFRIGEESYEKDKHVKAVTDDLEAEKPKIIVMVR